MDVTPERLLATAVASPERVAAHDKEGWLGLFSADAVVEDPVGSAPNRKGQGVRGGQDELARFYDTFIGPNRIRFEVAEDIVVGTEVVRDVRIHTELSTGFSIVVPAHLLYEIVEEGGVLRIRRMAAHWELPSLSKQALTGGLEGLVTMTVLSWHMLRVQGFAGVMGYLRGYTGIFGKGRRAAEALADTASRRDAAALGALFAGGEVRLEHPAGTPLDPEAFVASLPEGTTMTVSEAHPAGWATSFRFAFATPGGEALAGGIGFLTFDRATRKIATARLFPSG